MAYSYKLTIKEDHHNKVCYTREMLDSMPAFMLHDICIKEKIMTNSAGVSSSRLPREELTELILKYRGEEKDNFAKAPCAVGSDIAGELLRCGREKLEQELEVPAQIQLYRDSPVSLADDIGVVLPEKSDFTHAFLINGLEELLTLFQIVKKNHKHYLVMEKEWLSPDWEEGVCYTAQFLFFDSSTAAKLLSVYNGNDERSSLLGKELFFVRKKLNKLVLSGLKDMDVPLMIDFGTSNTTAGFCDEDGAVIPIRFQQESPCVNCTDCGRCYLYPSAAAAERCLEDGTLLLSFGYEALNGKKKDGCLTGQTYFYDMKRFANSYDEKIEAEDLYGRSCFIRKYEVVRQYLLSVIHKAQEQQKCRFTSLCFTTPVKQKLLLLSMYRAALPEYTIAEPDGIDEGMAVLYHEIEALRKEGKLTYKNEKALILDVGGGTSDMVCCSYLVEDTGIAYKLCIEEGYSSGDTNFGGNNITYRIMQFIKQKLYRRWTGEESSPILQSDFFDPYNAVDDFGGSSKLYEVFEDNYKKAEDLIPTVFSKELHNSGVRYIKVRSNFYCLWRLSEEIKKTFFQDSMMAQVDIPGDAYVCPSVFVNEKGKLAERKLEFTLTKEEILTVITPDIYGLVKRFLEPLCDEDGILSGYAIKLSGQTCQIPVFREAVKEFTVGQRSRTRRFERRRYGLKLKCIDGAVNAWRNQKYGYILSDVHYRASLVPYRLTAKTHAEQEVVLIHYRQSLDEIYHYLSRHANTKEVKFYLYSGGDGECHELILRLEDIKFSEVTYSALSDRFREKLLNQADIDTIMPDELRLFLFGHEQSWGFEVLPIARRDGTLYAGEVKFFPFEYSEWEVNFFDGCK